MGEEERARVNAMQAERCSDALAGWMAERGAMTLSVELVVDEAGAYRWCAAVVRDNHQPGCRHCLKALETSAEHPTVFGAIGELALEHTPLVDMDGQDWGRLGGE